MYLFGIKQLVTYESGMACDLLTAEWSEFRLKAVSRTQDEPLIAPTRQAYSTR
jgi:hypothetical protein